MVAAKCSCDVKASVFQSSFPTNIRTVWVFHRDMGRPLNTGNPSILTTWGYYEHGTKKHHNLTHPIFELRNPIPTESAFVPQ